MCDQPIEVSDAQDDSSSSPGTGANPLLPDVGVVAVVPDPVTRIWGPRLHVLSRLARYFHVVWCGPAPHWREALSSWGRLDPPADPPTLPPGFAVYTPSGWLSEFARPHWLREWTFQARLKQARRLLEDRRCGKIILYLWRPEFASALYAVPADLTCYHIDDEYTFSDVDLPIPEAEALLLSNVNQVFIHSPALLAKKGHINPHTAFVPNGVDFRAYARGYPEPADLASIPRPRIGYTGFIKKQLNWPLLDDLALRHRDWSFVYVGPVNNSLRPPPDAFQDLSQRPNVHFLGPKDVQVLSAYPQHFDVCIMPYQANDYTKYIYPLKLHEYLASGRPVVGTRLRSLEDFADVVGLASTPDEWSRALQVSLSLAANTAEQQRRRRSIARDHDWRVIVRQIAFTMATRLGPDYAERIG